MVQSIQREDLRKRIEAGQPTVLLEALPARYYRDSHLPGALNLPHDRAQELAPRLVPDKNAFIVVYCANTACKNSGIAAAALSALGYTRVHKYAEGKQDWADAGLPLESTLTATAAG